MSDELLLERRRAINRRAATKSRHKQKEQAVKVRQRYYDAQSTNTKLNYERKQLLKERADLLTKIQVHRDTCLRPHTLPPIPTSPDATMPAIDWNPAEAYDDDSQDSLDYDDIDEMALSSVPSPHRHEQGGTLQVGNASKLSAFSRSISCPSTENVFTDASGYTLTDLISTTESTDKSIDESFSDILGASLLHSDFLEARCPTSLDDGNLLADIPVNMSVYGDTNMQDLPSNSSYVESSDVDSELFPGMLLPELSYLLVSDESWTTEETSEAIYGSRSSEDCNLNATRSSTVTSVIDSNYMSQTRGKLPPVKYRNASNRAGDLSVTRTSLVDKTSAGRDGSITSSQSFRELLDGSANMESDYNIDNASDQRTEQYDISSTYSPIESKFEPISPLRSRGWNPKGNYTSTEFETNQSISSLFSDYQVPTTRECRPMFNLYAMESEQEGEGTQYFKQQGSEPRVGYDARTAMTGHDDRPAMTGHDDRPVRRVSALDALSLTNNELFTIIVSQSQITQHSSNEMMPSFDAYTTSLNTNLVRGPVDVANVQPNLSITVCEGLCESMCEAILSNLSATSLSSPLFPGSPRDSDPEGKYNLD